jgi:hypothetical protein
LYNRGDEEKVMKPWMGENAMENENKKRVELAGREVRG